MKIAIPIDNSSKLYHDNPRTAPKFIIYLVEGDRQNISYNKINTVDNPWNKKIITFEESEINCSCNSEQKNDIYHICEHYILLDVLAGCSYLLADHYCENLSKTLNNGGITVYKVPTIIKDVEIAIKNFLIGASFANTIQHINNAS